MLKDAPPHHHVITHYSSCVFLQFLLFLWQRELHSLPAFLHEQPFVVQLPLQLQCIIPCPPTDEIKRAASLSVIVGSDLQFL